MPPFFVTLPSNSSMDVYPDNKISHYTTQLPQEINLQDSEYEVALVEINYVHSFYNVQSGDCWLQYKVDRAVYMLQLAAGHYKPETLIGSLNKLVQTLSEENARNYLKFYFEPINQKASVTITNESTTLKMSASLQRKLQLEERNLRGNKTYFGQGAVSLNDTLSCIYVYCDLVKERVVGDKLVPLLRIVPVVRKPGQVVYKSFYPPQYFSLSHQQFRTVEIYLTDDTGNLIKFESGRVVVTLHFRPQQPL